MSRSTTCSASSRSSSTTSATTAMLSGIASDFLFGDDRKEATVTGRRADFKQPSAPRRAVAVGREHARSPTRRSARRDDRPPEAGLSQMASSLRELRQARPVTTTKVDHPRHGTDRRVAHRQGATGRPCGHALHERARPRDGRPGLRTTRSGTRSSPRSKTRRARASPVITSDRALRARTSNSIKASSSFARSCQQMPRSTCTSPGRRPVWPCLINRCCPRARHPGPLESLGGQEDAYVSVKVIYAILELRLTPGSQGVSRPAQAPVGAGMLRLLQTDPVDVERL